MASPTTRFVDDGPMADYGVLGQAGPATGQALALFLILYLMTTVALYNRLLDVSVSSRWPLAVAGLVFGPFAVAEFLSIDRRDSFALRPVWVFFLGYFCIEAANLALGSNEWLGVLSLLAVLTFIILTREYSRSNMTYATALTAGVYLLLAYPTAYLGGMVGVGVQERGIFVTHYLAGIEEWVVKGSYLSGRGVIGIVGGVLAVICLARGLGSAPDGKSKHRGGEEGSDPARTRTSGWSAATAGGLALGIAAVLLSDARGVIFAAAVVFGVLLLPLSRKARARTLFAAPLCLALVLPLYVLGAREVLSVQGELPIFSRQDLAVSDITRLHAWNESLGLAVSSLRTFVIGSGGIGSREVLLRDFASKHAGLEQLDSAHNLFLQVLVDGGLVLVVIFLVMLGRIAVIGWKNAGKMSRGELDAIGALNFLVLCGLTASLLNIDRVNEGMLFLVLALVAVDRHLGEIAAHAPPERPHEIGGGTLPW